MQMPGQELDRVGAKLVWSGIVELRRQILRVLQVQLTLPVARHEVVHQSLLGLAGPPLLAATGAELLNGMLVLLVQYLEDVIVRELENNVGFPRRAAQLVQGLLGWEY